MYNTLRVKFLNRRMKTRIVTDENYPEYKKDLEEILERSSGKLPLFAYEQIQDAIKKRSDIPEHMKADIIVTIRKHMQKSPGYQVRKILEQMQENKIFNLPT